VDLWVLLSAFAWFIQLAEVKHHVNKRIVKGNDILRVMRYQVITPF